MPRNLDTTLAAEMAKGSVRPLYLCEITLASGVQRVWTGVDPITWSGKTFSGLGELVGIGAIAESSGVQADGTTISLNVLPSQLAIPAYPATPPDPPYSPPAGQSVAWSFSKIWSQDSGISTGPSIYSGGLRVDTFASVARTTGIFSISAGRSLPTGRVSGTWTRFAMPLEIPSGATIRDIQQVAVEGGMTSAGFSGSGFNSVYDATLYNTVPGAPGNSGLVAFVGLAVYYDGVPLTNTSLLYEALDDVRVGGRVRIWFGMLSSAGAIVGTPFLSFDGLVDEPSLEEDVTATKIVLALENRLRNLQRAGGRRYTAADQKLDYPNDSGLNQVEALQEISLIWGS